MLALYNLFETLGCILRTPFTFMLYLGYVLKLQTCGVLGHYVVLGNSMLELCLA